MQKKEVIRAPTHTSDPLKFKLARNARVYSTARSIGFCAIWVSISSSSGLSNLPLLAPHTSGPRDVPRCGALSLLQKDAALQGGSSRNRCRLNVKLRDLRDWCVFFYCFSSPNPFRIYLNLREQFRFTSKEPLGNLTRQIGVE